MQYADLEITEENGWSKKVSLTKAIILIGSAAQCDVQVNTRSIAPVQLQLLSSSDLPTGCRLVNLSAPITFLVNGVSQTVAQFGSCDVHQHDELKLGEYRIVFDLPYTAEQMEKTDSIEASLSFVNAVVRPEYPLEGKLVVKNLGKQDETQFQVDLQGLPADCFQIDPIPLLYPGAQEEIRLRLFHHTFYPEVGQQTIYVIITSPNNYPGEELVLEQRIYVAPVFNQTLDVIDDIAEQEAIAKQKAALAEEARAQEVHARENLPKPVVSPPVEPPIPTQPVELLKEDSQLPDLPTQQKSLPEPEQTSSATWNGDSGSTPENLEPFNETPEVPGANVEPVETILEKALVVEGQGLKQNPVVEPEIINSPKPTRVLTFSADQEEISPVEPHEQPKPQAPTVGPDRSKLKVMRQTSHEFWNED